MEDPATVLVPLLEEALPYELTAWIATEETAWREAKARLARVNAAFCFLGATARVGPPTLGDRLGFH